MTVHLKSFSFWVAIALLRTGPSFAQSGWYQQPPWPTTEYLLAVATPDSSTIVAAGERGTIVRTTDGGASWTHPVSGTTNLLEGVTQSTRVWTSTSGRRGCRWMSRSRSRCNSRRELSADMKVRPPTSMTSGVA
jgi:hypothetical protein